MQATYQLVNVFLSLNPSIFCHLSRLQWPYAKQVRPNVLHSSHVLQLFLEGSGGIFRPNGMLNPSSVGWICPWVFFPLRMSWIPQQGGFRGLNHLNWRHLTWRRSAECSFLISEFIPFLRARQGSVRRKLISAPLIHELIISVTIQASWLWVKVGEGETRTSSLSFTADGQVSWTSLLSCWSTFNMLPQAILWEYFIIWLGELSEYEMMLLLTWNRVLWKH